MSDSIYTKMFRWAFSLTLLLPLRCSGLSTRSAPPNTARQEIASLVRQNGNDLGANLNDPTLGKCIDQLLEESSSIPETKVFDPISVAGCWQVIHAPHLAALSNFALSKFRPIQYYLTDDLKMASSVRYNSFVFGYGWLSTSGYYEIDTENNGNVKIVWDKAWWNPEFLDRPTPPEDGFLPGLIQSLGTAGFIESLSVFPIGYVDEDLVVFYFSGLKITAAKIPDPKPALCVKAQEVQ